MHPEAYDFIPLEVEEVCFVVDGADPLAREAHLTLADLGGNPWIVPQATIKDSQCPGTAHGPN